MSMPDPAPSVVVIEGVVALVADVVVMEFPCPDKRPRTRRL
jgi:hypothetical protein